MFASLKFRDVFAIAGTGIPPQLYATGSVGGGIIPVTGVNTTSVGPQGNYFDFKRWVAIFQTGSGNSITTAYNAWIGAASVSNGTYSMLPATSTSTFVAQSSYNVLGGQTTSQFGSLAAMVIEVRAEYLSGGGAPATAGGTTPTGVPPGITYIRPIISVSNSSGYASCLMLQFVSGIEPASLGDNPQNFVLQECDAF